MPKKAYKKKRYYRRYGRRSQWGNWIRKQPGTASLWDIATSAAGSLIKTYLNTERKLHDFTPSAITPGTTGNTQCLTLIPLGPGPSERDGRQVRMSGLGIKAVMTLNSSANNDTVRMLLVQARTDVVPTIADILLVSNTLSFRQINEVRDYKVLLDKTYNLDSSKTSHLQVSINRNIRSKLQFNTNDTAGTATPEWGHLYLIWLCRENSNLTTITYWSRLRYIDN